MDNERASSIGGERAESNNTKQSSSLTFLSPLSLSLALYPLSVSLYIGSKDRKKKHCEEKTGKAS